MFKIGCDPECFLLDKKNQVISAIGRIGGTKYQPKPVLEKYAPGFAIQEDNVLLEYNIPPANNFNEFTDYLDLIHHYLDRSLLEMDLKRSTIASHSMDPDQMTHPMAWVFGCEPDFNAWTLQVNPKPKCDNPLLRSAGGHIHIGMPDMTRSQVISTVRWLDRLLGRFLLRNDPDKNRAKLYGAPGAMRFKPYGFEYRTPSNWWTFQPTSVIQEIYYIIETAIRKGSNGRIHSAKQGGFHPSLLESVEASESWVEE